MSDSDDEVKIHPDDTTETASSVERSRRQTQLLPPNTINPPPNPPPNPSRRSRIVGPPGSDVVKSIRTTYDERRRTYRRKPEHQTKADRDIGIQQRFNGKAAQYVKRNQNTNRRASDIAQKDECKPERHHPPPQFLSDQLGNIRGPGTKRARRWAKDHPDDPLGKHHRSRRSGKERPRINPFTHQAKHPKDEEWQNMNPGQRKQYALDRRIEERKKYEDNYLWQGDVREHIRTLMQQIRDMPAKERWKYLKDNFGIARSDGPFYRLPVPNKKELKKRITPTLEEAIYMHTLAFGGIKSSGEALNMAQRYRKANQEIRKKKVAHRRGVYLPSLFATYLKRTEPNKQGLTIDGQVISSGYLSFLSFIENQKEYYGQTEEKQISFVNYCVALWNIVAHLLQQNDDCKLPSPQDLKRRLQDDMWQFISKVYNRTHERKEKEHEGEKMSGDVKLGESRKSALAPPLEDYTEMKPIMGYPAFSYGDNVFIVHGNKRYSVRRINNNIEFLDEGVWKILTQRNEPMS